MTKQFAQIHTKLTKVPQMISKYHSDFAKLDQAFILLNLTKLYKIQTSIMHSTCLETKGLSAEPMLKISKHIFNIIGKARYLEILKGIGEDYSLFQSDTSIVATYVFLTAMYLDSKNIKGLELTYSSYGCYTYTLMFNKRIVYCKPDVFERTLQEVHGLNEFSKRYKNGGHIGVITYFVEAEMNKVVQFVNNGKLNQTRFTRSFSYIKTRFNQTLGSFASVYHKLINETSNDDINRDEGLTSSQLGMLIKQVLTAHKMVTTLPDQAVIALNRDTGVSDSDAKVFIQTVIKLSLDDKNYYMLLEDFYQSLFRLNVNSVKAICTSEFLKLLIKIITAKNTNATVVDLKTKIDRLISYTADKAASDISELSKPIKIRSTRRLFIRMIYFIYIKNSICSDH